MVQSKRKKSGENHIVIKDHEKEKYERKMKWAYVKRENDASLLMQFCLSFPALSLDGIMVTDD